MLAGRGSVAGDRGYARRDDTSRTTRTIPNDRGRAVVMADELRGQKVAFVATDGVEQVELTEPWRAVEAAGGEPVLVSIERGEIEGFNHLDHGDRFAVDVDAQHANFDEFAALVLPGGVANPDRLRTDDAMVRFIGRFAEAGKPIGVICHGPWTLIEADA